MDNKTVLREDNFSTDDFWILVEGPRITIAKQQSGAEHEWLHTIPKKDFEQIIDWYTKSQRQ